MHSLACFLLSVVLATMLSGGARAAQESITVAAAADLKFALADLVADFQRTHPGTRIDIIYGSSGKFRTQIEQGAPYDLYFSADIAYPRALADKGLAATPAIPYARGRLVLWSTRSDIQKLTLADLQRDDIKRIAIANPRHAPYGKRAEEALRTAGVWQAIQSKLIFGENVAQTAQFVETGNADAGLIALSLALSPALATRGGYVLVNQSMHEPLLQGFIITRHGRDKTLARRFADFMRAPPVAALLARYGFEAP